MLYKFFYLSHEDRILKDYRSLGPCGKEDIRESKTEVLTYVGHGQERTPINTALTVNEDGAGSMSQERVEDLLKPWKPVEDVNEQTILSIEAGVVLGERFAKPRWTGFFVCTINDMRNAVLPGEVWR